MKVRRVFHVVLASALLAGCAGNRIEGRKRERAGAYAALPAAQQQLVDSGRIDVGMSADAVYVAWGKPALVVPTAGTGSFTWIYRCREINPRPGWETREVQRRQRVGHGATYYTFERGTEFVSEGYDCAEVNFENNVVKSWRELPKPDDF
jgi:hypothetical protein